MRNRSAKVKMNALDTYLLVMKGVLFREVRCVPISDVTHTIVPAAPVASLFRALHEAGIFGGSLEDFFIANDVSLHFFSLVDVICL